MSAIEFNAQSGKAFSVQLYDATTLATIGSPLTPTEPATGLYRVSTGASTGIVYVAAIATNLLVVGFANLDDASANGYSPLKGSYDDASAHLAGINAELVAMQGGAFDAGTDSLEDIRNAVSNFAIDLTPVTEQLDLIQAKTDLLATADVTVTSPVSEAGTLGDIIIGDDYLAANARSFDFLIDPIPGASAETATCFFGGERESKGSWLVTGTVTEVGDKWQLRFELASDETIDCLKGTYYWSVELRSAESKRLTRITGEVDLVDSYTIE